MIRHLVLFSLRPEIGATEIDDLFDEIRKLGGIPAVRRIETGTLLDPRDPGYRNHMSADFRYALLADFDDEDGLYAYQRDPSHIAVAGEIRKRVSVIKVIDFVTPD